MNLRVRGLALGLIALTGFAVSAEASEIISIVRHLTRVKILESNNVTTRPGSIYDNITYFESILAWRPGFNY